MAEYRKKVLTQFELAQVEYLQRKKERGHSQLTAQKLRQKLKSFSKTQQLDTENPKQPNFIEARSFHKLGKIQSCVVLKRLFAIEDDKFIQYKNEESSQPTQKVNITQNRVILEQLQVEGKNPKIKWTDTAASFRLCIRLEDKSQKKNREVFVYNNDLNELKALLVKLKFASIAGLRNELAITMVKLSLLYNMLQFQSVWKDFLTVNWRRNNRAINFKLISQSLVNVAGLHWQRSRLALQRAENYVIERMEYVRSERHRRIMNVGGELKLKSTFKLGRARPDSRRGQFLQISLIMNHRIEQLINLVRTRRSVRNQQIQLEVEYLNNLHIKGYLASEASIQINDKHGDLQQKFCISDGNARLLFQGDHLLIENLDPQKLKKQTFPSHQLNYVVPFADISLMTTNLIHDVHRQQEMDDQVEYQIVLHGPFVNQTLKSTALTNVLAEHCKYTHLRHLSNQWFKVNVKEIQLPKGFVSKFNNKGFLKVRLNQLWNSQKKSRFYVTSHEIFLSLSQDQLRLANDDRITIKIDSLDFFIDKLIDNSEERFTLQVFFVQSVAPIHQALRDYILLNDSKIIWDEQTEEPLKYQNCKSSDNNIELKSLTQAGTIKLTYQISQHQKQHLIEPLDFREGTRLLVGRFVLFDPENRCQVCQVVQCNSDSTVMLRSVATHSLVGKRVSLNKLKLIERYGVSVYQQENLPKELIETKFGFMVTIKSRNKRLLNTIQMAIQSQQVALQYKKIDLSDQQLIATGRLQISILHAQNLKNSPALKSNTQIKLLKPYVRVTLQQNNEEISNTAMVSEIIEKAESFDVQSENDTTKRDIDLFTTWVSQKNKLGHIFELGTFQKIIGKKQPNARTLQKTIKIQVYHADGAERNIILGFCTIDADRLIDLRNFASEQSIMLEIEGTKSGILTFQS